MTIAASQSFSRCAARSPSSTASTPLCSPIAATIRHWRVVVICPSRALNFGDAQPVAEFLQERVHWIELLPALRDPGAPPLLRTLALLVQTEEDLPATTATIRAQVAGTALEEEIADGIAAILVSRFSGRSIPEICAMGGITLEDFTQRVAYREIYGLGRQEGQTEGRRQGELAMTLRLLHLRCGLFSAVQDARICQLPLQRLEALAEALLDFRGPEDLDAWLAAGR